MSFKSLSTAKLLLTVLAVIALTNGYLARQWRAEVAVAQGDVSKAQSNEREAQRAFAEMRDVLKPDAQTLPLQQAVSVVVLDVFNQRVPNGVTVSSATPGRLSISGAVAGLDSLAENVPKSSVRSVRVNIKGTYTTYQGFLEYVKALQAHQVSIVSLKVLDQGFELGVRVFGTADKS